MPFVAHFPPPIAQAPMPIGVESILSTVGGGRRCDAFYAICSIEFTDEFFPASAENTKSVSASGVPQSVPARAGTHSPFKEWSNRFRTIEVYCQSDRRQAADSVSKDGHQQAAPHLSRGWRSSIYRKGMNLHPIQKRVKAERGLTFQERL